ncbi:hypothetical protein ACH42_16205 [Endozoicomonas sp. (ex Bugula neritina AB1)]|nr:hypothetical protein ACH42_16205 [Endozoicomonas sp. (ex Bugula neritina AB1)]
MRHNFTIRDRQTSEQGTILQCLSDGWVRVLMDSGQIRDYRPQELIGQIRVSSLSAVQSRYDSQGDRKLSV